jgi:D-arabinose 1-dehydrogenase-like Zn-dependent alcohol dehydrogenase
MARMSRAVVMPGDGTWELRELRVPDPPSGGAVLRVEAVGMCHSDIDHMHGIVHTPWGATGGPLTSATSRPLSTRRRPASRP